ncbi:hypothetical protein AALB19_10540 [Oscillospiraceae bacterium 50-58]
MDEKILYVKWDTGYLNIDMEQFFPVNLAKFKKLLKIIDETRFSSNDCEQPDRLREELKLFFQEKIPACTATAKVKANEYADLKQKVHDTERLIHERKKPNGVPLTRPEYEVAQEDLRKYRNSAAIALSEYKINSQNVKRFERLLQELTK